MRYKVCVFGASGYIGKYIFNRMKEENIEVIGFARKKENEYYYFDITESSFEHINNYVTNCDMAVIAIAQCKIDMCSLDYYLSYQINVVQTLKLIAYLNDRNIKTIVFSSDNVFGDDRGDYSENDDTCPINKYGTMKAILEKEVINNFPKTCVFRLPKVYGLGKEKNNILYNFLQCVENKQIIKCILGTRMSVVSQEDVYQACKLAYEFDLSGLYNLCENNAYSRKQLAQIFVNIIEAKNDIIEVPMEDFEFVESRPLRINMKNTKFVQYTNYEMANYYNNVKKYVEMWGS